MSESTDEKILVVPTSLVAQYIDLEKGGLFLNAEPILNKLFESDLCLFKERDLVEKDPNFKQLIPYILINCKGRLFSYVRGKAGGENRLHDFRSLGIGGHINDNDGNFSTCQPKQIYDNGLLRELTEEVKIDSKILTPIRKMPETAFKPLAFIYDGSTNVGEVHLGVVHLISIESPKVRAGSDSIRNIAFTSLGYLYGIRETLEGWSQICLDKILDLVLGKDGANLRV